MNKNVETAVINNSVNINKTNNDFSPKIIESTQEEEVDN